MPNMSQNCINGYVLLPFLGHTQLPLKFYVFTKLEYVVKCRTYYKWSSYEYFYSRPL